MAFLSGTSLIAGDDGPRAALAPLVAAGAAFRPPRAGDRALVVGTSQSNSGFAEEIEARRLAARLGLPIACVEDFPGNYRDVEEAPTRLLVVEAEFSRALYAARFGGDAPPIQVIAPARYDALRGPRRARPENPPPQAVLWAGQPETEACLATLDALSAFLAQPDVLLLFRSHPRDPGVATGAYRSLLSGLRHIDVSGEPLAQSLARPLRLVLTQYSSVAVEAGFLGVPSVHVLLPAAGEALLYAQKGYRVPMPCAAGASFLVRDRREIRTLDRALRDDAARSDVMAKFRALYAADTPQGNRLCTAIAGIMP